VLYAPENTQTTVFANRVVDSNHATQSE
jgi:hypothetical protein